MRITDNFQEFSPQEYLQEYYTEIYNGNEYLLKFYHDTFLQIPPVTRYLEIGGGPTIYQLISVSQKVEKIVFAEYLDANRIEVGKWFEKKPDRFNWDLFFQFVQALEIKVNPTVTVTEMKDRLRRRLDCIIKCDVRRINPLDPYNELEFDIVASNFCLESITDNQADFLNSLHNITRLLKPGGLLIMSLIKNARYYTVGQIGFKAFPVDEDAIFFYLMSANYTNIDIYTMPAEDGHGYHGMMFLTATKN